MQPDRDCSRPTGIVRFLRAAAFALLVGMPVAAQCAPKTDVVILLNGDHLTGEVEQLSHGQLALSTDDMGTLYIEWDKIASLTTGQELQVELADGQRVFGKAPDPASKPGAIRILTGYWSGAGTAVELPFHEIVRIATVEGGDSWYKGLEGAFSLGYSYTQANDLNVLNVYGDIGARDREKKWKVVLDSQVTTQAEDPSSQRASLISTLEHFLQNRYYTESSLEFTRNQELGLDLRSLIGATFGRYLVQGRHKEWRAGAGLAASTERDEDGKKRDSLEAQLNTNLTIFRYDHPKTDVSISLTLLPSLSESGRLRGETSIQARRELVTDLFIQISLYDSYDNQPSEGSPTNDWGLTTSIGYSF